ncbi:MAG: rhodanese-like domain-containing protein [Cellvibrionaceae bacterium]
MENVVVFLQEQALIVAALAILIFAFLRRESSESGSKLSLSEVVQAMNSEKAVLLDIRESKEFGQGHVANAINIAHPKVESSIGQLDKYREKQIIVTDAMGQHSSTVTRLLAKKGFAVARMRGGMSEWKQEGLPLVK